MPIDPALLARPENRIMLMCAQGLFEKDDFARTLEQVSDWRYLISQLQFHRLTLLFLHRVKGHENLLPPDSREELQQLGDETLHLNLFLLTELQRVVTVLTKTGVRVLSYKGPSLADNAYGTIALRRFLDLDLLVSRRDRIKAVNALKKYGFQEFAAQTALTPYLRHLKVRTDYEIQLKSEEEKTFLDLHWSVLPPFESFPLDFEQMWKHRVPMSSLSGVQTLGSEDLILVLCFHGLKHLWEEMEWIGCLLHLLQNAGETLDWHSMEAIATSAGCQRILYLGLRLANDLSEGLEVKSIKNLAPADIWSKIDEDVTVDHLAQRVWNLIFSRHAEHSKNDSFQFVRDYFMRFLFGMQSRRSTREKWIFCVGMFQVGLLSLERSTVVAGSMEKFANFFERIGTKRTS